MTFYFLLSVSDLCVYFCLNKDFSQSFRSDILVSKHLSRIKTIETNTPLDLQLNVDTSVIIESLKNKFNLLIRV